MIVVVVDRRLILKQLWISASIHLNMNQLLLIDLMSKRTISDFKIKRKV